MKNTLAILVVLVAGLAQAQQKTGHVEWQNSGFKADATDTYIMPAGNSHTVDCQQNTCTLDSAHGYMVVVLADGSRLDGLHLTQMGTGGSLYRLALEGQLKAAAEPWPTFVYTTGPASVGTGKAVYVAGHEYDIQ